MESSGNTIDARAKKIFQRDNFKNVYWEEIGVARTFGADTPFILDDDDREHYRNLARKELRKEQK